MEVFYESEALNGGKFRGPNGTRVYTHTAEVEVYWDEEDQTAARIIYVEFCLHELLDPEIRDDLIRRAVRGLDDAPASLKDEYFDFQVLEVENEHRAGEDE